MSTNRRIGRKYIISLSAVIAAVIIIFTCALLGGCKSQKQTGDGSEGPEYIIPMSVYADEDTFSLHMIIRDCNASRVIMNVKSGDKTIGSVQQDISVTKQQGINITLEPKELSGKVPQDVSAEVMIYSKANADNKLSEDPLDRAVIQLKNYTVQLGPDTVYCVAHAMSLEEKAELMVGVDVSENTAVKNAAGATAALDKYGIPSMCFAYGASGISAGDKTIIYPSASVLASTWNTALTERIGAAVGNDAKHFNIDTVIVPSLNIQRDVLGGNNYALYSEDPILTGYMGAAFVNGVQSRNAGAAIGNFVLDTQKTNASDMIIRERALREIYLTGFEIAVMNSSPYGITAYDGKINGQYAASRDDLMDSLLRSEWGYSGFVLYKRISDRDDITEKATQADLILSGGDMAAGALVNAVREEKISETQLYASCVNILQAIVRSNTFNGRNGGVLDTAGGTEAAKEAAAEGMVLLKNDKGALPAKGKNLALFGNAQLYTRIGGTGGCDADPLYEVNFLQGFENAGFIADTELKTIYSQAKDDPHDGGSEYNPEAGTREIIISEEAAARAAADNDFAVICISRQSGAEQDHSSGSGDYMLNDRELVLIERVSEAFRAEEKPVTVIINAGSPIEVSSWQDKVDAILYTGFAGIETGNVAAEILSGSINPSGKLAASFPVSYTDSPSAADFGNVQGSVKYSEDIYVGYRFYETFKVETAYPFGYGLSYTTFEYSDVNVSSSIYTDSISVSVNVKNTGDIAGKDVVQLYIKKPYSEENEQPETVLASFAKTDMLEPGASQKVTLVINNYSMRSYSEENADWYVGEGMYTAYVAPSVKDTGSELLRFSFRVEDRISVKSVSNCCVLSRNMDIYKRYGDDAFMPENMRSNNAAGKSAKASCSAGSLEPEYAIDGSITTWWSPSGDCGEEYDWIIVDLGSSLKISEVALRWRKVTKPYIVEIGTDDNDGWTEIARVSRDFAMYESIVTASEARYVRIRLFGEAHPELYEIEVYG